MSNFLEAVRAGNFGAAAEMLQQNPRLAEIPDGQGLLPLMLAMYSRHVDVAFLIATVKGTLTPFEAACVGDAVQLRAWVEAHAGEVDMRSPDGFTALGYAAYFGHAEAVDVLLNAGADPNTLSENPLGVSPFHSALASGHQSVIERMLSGGADPSSPSAGGYTPLHYAADIGDVALAIQLLEMGADSSIKNADGHTPAELGIEVGHEHVSEAIADFKK